MLDVPKSADRDRLHSLAIAGLSLGSKAFLPIVILVLALLYKPTIEGLVGRATQAEVFGTKLVFDQSRAFRGVLSPIELYFLISSAHGYGKPFGDEGWNLDALEESGNIAAIYSLRDKGLVEFRISDNSPELAAHGYGKKSIATKPTERGRDLLVELGLKPEMVSFPSIP